MRERLLPVPVGDSTTFQEGEPSAPVARLGETGLAHGHFRGREGVEDVLHEVILDGVGQVRERKIGGRSHLGRRTESVGAQILAQSRRADAPIFDAPSCAPGYSNCVHRDRVHGSSS